MVAPIGLLQKARWTTGALSAGNVPQPEFSEVCFRGADAVRSARRSLSHSVVYRLNENDCIPLAPPRRRVAFGQANLVWSSGHSICPLRTSSRTSGAHIVARSRKYLRESYASRRGCLKNEKARRRINALRGSDRSEGYLEALRLF